MQKLTRIDFENCNINKYIYKVRALDKCGHNKYYIETYGCQMNVHDSERYSGLLCSMGYEATTNKLDADIILFNTCCVRENAELRVYGNVGALKQLKEEKPWLKLGICGCMMQQADVVAHIKKRYPFVDIILGSHNPYDLPELLYNCITQNNVNSRVLADADIILEGDPIKRDNTFSAWVTIMYGCNNFCSYCIVPYVRGRERSRSSKDIIDEVRQLAQNGCREITLLGQNVNSYGKDCGEISFAQLLRQLNDIEGIERIGFMTSHPKDCSDELIQTIAECSKVSRQLHLPVQSGSDRILKLMNRRYTVKDYINLINKAKNAIAGLNVTTDIIVGFPGETEEDFLQTVELFKQVGFASAYTFIYSKRNGTPAASMDEQVSIEIKKRRLAQLIEVQAQCTEEIQKKYMGNTYKVLVESVSKRSKAKVSGRTHCGRMVTFEGSSELIGSIVDVKITEVKANTLLGVLK